jgi:hypothetical protein
MHAVQLFFAHVASSLFKIHPSKYMHTKVGENLQTPRTPIKPQSQTLDIPHHTSLLAIPVTDKGNLQILTQYLVIKENFSLKSQHQNLFVIFYQRTMNYKLFLSQFNVCTVHY